MDFLWERVFGRKKTLEGGSLAEEQRDDDCTFDTKASAHIEACVLIYDFANSETICLVCHSFGHSSGERFYILARELVYRRLLFDRTGVTFDILILGSKRRIYTTSELSQNTIKKPFRTSDFGLS